MMNRSMGDDYHSVPIDECIDDLLTRDGRIRLTSSSANRPALISSNRILGRVTNCCEDSSHLKEAL
jgi:hypothetical protein